MRTSWIVGIIAVILIASGGVWYYQYRLHDNDGLVAVQDSGQNPSGAMGTNGSADQGNTGGADNGTPQQPQGDGTGVAENLILGLNQDASLGNYLSAYNGMTVYTFTKDKPGTTTCYGQCATNWPPYTVSSAADVHVPATVTGAVGTIARADGTLQVTYKGMPLYFWKNDNKPGDTTGEGVGGVWHVAKP